jgi:hypothetical protein
MINQNWLRWITHSVNKHFVDNKGSLNALTEQESLEEKNAVANQIEIRILDPAFVELGKTAAEGSLLINILVQTVKSETTLYKHEQNIGEAVAAFALCIPILKKGTEAGDDGASIGNLQRGNSMEIRHFGQPEADVPLLQSTVESRYTIQL